MIVKNITIVGGGTAGWLTAAYLSKQIPHLSITLIDKIIPSTVGVGEGTLLNLRSFLEECGFPEYEWILNADATYKSSILFANWQEPGKDVWHPFFKRPTVINTNGMRLQDLWTQNQDLNFAKYASSLYETSLDNKIDTDKINSYAYHVDCGKLVSYIHKKLKNKIKFIQSDVVEINTEHDNIVSLKLENGDIITSDLFVDSTGWKNVLGKPKEKVNFDRLFCNAAIAGHIPYKNREKELNPYVISEAVDHGWIWNIPVSTRIGSGLVFNKDITDVEEAKKYFCNYWDNRISPDNLKVLDWTPYYYKDMWVGNKVAIGLSSGFIEPLESTGVAMITAGITQLCNAIREQYVQSLDIDYFNVQMSILYEDCADFVSMHYYNNIRNTPFWNHVKENFKITERMQYYLDRMKDPSQPLPYDGHYNSIFIGANWTTWFAQMDIEIVPRITGYSQQQSKDLVLKEYVLQEKYRASHSVPHSIYVDRIREQYGIVNENN
jgi:tryptophan halogenase